MLMASGTELLTTERSHLFENMNHSTLFENPFQLNCHTVSCSDYTSQRQFAGSIDLSVNEKDSSQHASAISQSLAHPVPMTPGNGLRYNTQQSAMQGVPYSSTASPTILLSTTDSCSEVFPSTSNLLYSHPSGLSYDRVSDFRGRASALQSPSAIVPGIHSENVLGNPGLMNRAENYSYTLQRGPFPSLSGLNDMPRYPSYTSTPRTLNATIDRQQTSMYGQAGNMLMESMQHLPQPAAGSPPFNETDILYPIVTANQTIKPEIHAKIQKNVFPADKKWTCYRRNYISISCSFSLHPFTHSAMFIETANHQGTQPIRRFAMSISAIVDGQYEEARELVQHSPKRDKQSERRPGKIVLQPSPPSPLIPGQGSSKGCQLGFPLEPHVSGLDIDYASYANTPGSPQPPTQYTFERIQFQKATANNGKRRAQQQYYKLVVDLYAEISGSTGAAETQWIKIARRLSDPMVVRGRSPGHYKDSRRDSAVSMGSEGTGRGMDDGNGAALLPNTGLVARSHLNLIPYGGQRNGTQYSGGSYRRTTGSEQSPASDTSLISPSSSSPEFDILSESMNPMDTIKGESTGSYRQDSTFSVMSPGQRLERLHNHMPFDYRTLKGEEHEGQGHFSDTFDPMVSVIPNDETADSQYMKQHSRNQLTGIEYADDTAGRYDPIHGQICT